MLSLFIVGATKCKNFVYKTFRTEWTKSKNFMRKVFVFLVALKKRAFYPTFLH